MLLVSIYYMHVIETQEFCGEETYRLKETHPYFDQVQGQLYMVRTPKDSTIIRETQDPDWQPNISVLTALGSRVVITTCFNDLGLS